MRRPLLIAGLLAALVVGIYWPARQFEFIHYDDPQFITENPIIQKGLTANGLWYGLTQQVVGNWHPLTTWSHMLDCELFGPNPGAHHMVNVALHALNAALLFLMLRQLTRTTWRSALVAALFALHPLRVESVAWISERKDLLCGLFFILTLWAYARYAESRISNLGSRVSNLGSRVSNLESRISDHASRISNLGSRISPWYAIALALFSLALMSKPMAVTLPFVLLLVDFWPLQRFGHESRISDHRSRTSNHESRITSLESRVSGLGSRTSNHESRISDHGSRISNLESRISNLASLVLEKLPFFALSAAASFATFAIQQQAGAMTLMDRISLGQRFGNAAASCLKYLAKTVWPANLAAVYPHPAKNYFLNDQWTPWQFACAVAVLLLISLACVLRVRKQPWLVVGWFWFLGTLVPVIGIVQVGEQAMADRYTYLPLIGPVLALVWTVYDWLSKRQWTATRSDWRLKFACSLAILCVAALSAATATQLTYWHDTVSLFDHAAAVTPDNPSARFAIGVGLEKQGENQKAMVQYRVALLIDPAYQKAHFNLGQLLRKESRWREAAEQYEAVLRCNPADVASHLNLAGACQELGETRKAMDHFQTALQLDPNSIEALNNLAWILATRPEPEFRNGPRAVELAERACAISEYKLPLMIGTLAAAYAEAGAFDKATATAEKAAQCAEAAGQPEVATRNRELAQLYKSGKAFREP